MRSEEVATAERATDAEVMAAVEDGPAETFVIADVSRDDAYVSAPLSDTLSLSAWR